MLKIFKRANKIWKLSKKDSKLIDNLSEESIDKIPDEGDGNAVYFGEGTQEEFKEFEKDSKGLKGIFGL